MVAFTMASEIDNKTSYEILDSVYKDIDLHPYVKHFKSKRGEHGVIFNMHVDNASVSSKRPTNVLSETTF